MDCGRPDGLCTDECVPKEDGHLGRSSCPQPKIVESVLEQFDPYGNESRSGGHQAHNPFEIEPGHFDFLCQDEVSQVHSRPFSSAPSSTKGDSSHSSRGHSTHSSSSGSVRRHSLTQFMADWVEDTSEVGTRPQNNLLAIEYPNSLRSAPAKNLPVTRPNTVAAQPSRGGAQPIRVVAQTNRGEAQANRGEVHSIRGEAHSNRGGAQPSRVGAQSLLASYTWEEIVAITVNSKYELGRGGFGSVYMGFLSSNKRVAVKILDAESRQGDSEFLNEVDLLSRVNHVNLVKLLGFCQEGIKRALVYEFAEEGTLWDHLHGKAAAKGTSFDWKTRLKIGLEAACGFEYLHTGCTPRIIHRDIKSSNILLTKHLVAKVADFGLSKLGQENDNCNQTHLSTMVKGTPGYLDPEYCRTSQLNEKSDIFSFGIVLLEIITGRRPIVQNVPNSFIGNWVRSQWKTTGMKGVVDPRLGETYNPKAMKVVVTLALKCIEDSATGRPDIRTVVEQLRAATVLEHNTVQATKWSLKSLLR